MANCYPRIGTYFANIVEVPVVDGLLGRQLAQLVEQHVQLELGRQVRQPTVAERLPVENGSGRRSAVSRQSPLTHWAADCSVSKIV